MGVEKESLNPLSNGSFDIIYMPVYNYYNSLCSRLRYGGEKGRKGRKGRGESVFVERGWSKLRLLNG